MGFSPCVCVSVCVCFYSVLFLGLCTQPSEKFRRNPQPSLIMSDASRYQNKNEEKKDQSNEKPFEKNGEMHASMEMMDDTSLHNSSFLNTDSPAQSVSSIVEVLDEGRGELVFACLTSSRHSLMNRLESSSSTTDAICGVSCRVDRDISQNDADNSESHAASYWSETGESSVISLRVGTHDWKKNSSHGKIRSLSPSDFFEM